MAKNPIFNLLANIALNIISEKLQAQGQQDKPKGFPEMAEVVAIQKIKQKDGAVVLILGKRESGKSKLAYRLAEIIGRPTYAITPEEKAPQGVTELKIEQLLEEPPPYSTLILDDLATFMGSRDYTNVWVRNVERIIPVVRHLRKLDLIFVSQTSGQADKWVLDSDLVFMKPMGWLYADIERGSVKRLADQIQPIFRQMPEMAQKQHAFLLCDDYKGLVRINLPGSFV